MVMIMMIVMLIIIETLIMDIIIIIIIIFSKMTAIIDIVTNMYINWLGKTLANIFL